MINPVINGANAFITIWNFLPLPFRALFSIALFVLVIYTLYRLLAR